jgi:hypothetical protein
MKIVIQPEVAVELNEVRLVQVRDSVQEKHIIARIEGIPRGILLWSGEEYDSPEASNWTNESARKQAAIRLTQNPVPFV